MYSNLFGGSQAVFCLINACCIFWTPEYNTTFLANRLSAWGPIYKESYDVSYYDSRKIVTNLS